MNQNDFSLIEKMNIQCDVVFSNQANHVGYTELKCENFRAKMISTNTRGVGKNRNISLTYAEGDIILFADDDMKYVNGYTKLIENEFECFPDADVIIFNITSNDKKRPQLQNHVTKRLHKLSKMPYGAPRIAIRKTSWEKSNVWFTPLFGGGAKYTSGEDSIFLQGVKKKGLHIYISDKTIGEVDMSNSSWFSGRNEEYFFNKGAYCKAVHPHFFWLWKFYYCIRLKSHISFFEKMSSFDKGVHAYMAGRTFGEQRKDK
jgi:glycosyltransferase involved in cell wall biosynthesis